MKVTNQTFILLGPVLAIAFGTGQVSMQTMVREGLMLSFIMSCLIALMSYILLA